ncbi:MAG: 3-phosphoshikimate 1-carboxyvinyltransferase [Candidatus Omnitrophica bacterium]|nr:3-phosphoshikimate 1-carboxyvinyltransferase [Candidatus Omnitrophota bacterium]
MILNVPPVRKLTGSIDLPASKSYSIRAFFVAACGGRSRILGASDCDDAKVALRVARAFGAKVTAVPGGCLVNVPAFQKKKAMLAIDVGESGTSLRFVLPLLPQYAAKARVVGRGTLMGRPNYHLCAALREQGLEIRGEGANESVPISFSGGDIPCGRVEIDGSLSSQFVSALMIAAPLAENDTRLVMAGKTLVSQDYVIMTRQILERAGIRVTVKGRREFLIPGQQHFKGLKDFHVPSDYGLAAFFMAAAALVASDITLKGSFDDALIQSDGAIIPLLTRMGLRMQRTGRSIRIKGPQDLKGGVFSLKSCPDLVPIMAVTAMFAKGVTRLKDIGHARVKESDRISDLRQELLKVGADIRETKDELIIHPCSTYTGGATLDPHHDHRLAMAFAVLGLKVGLKVRDVECTAKSYPGFVKSLKAIM